MTYAKAEALMSRELGIPKETKTLIDYLTEELMENAKRFGFHYINGDVYLAIGNAKFEGKRKGVCQ